MGKQWGFYNTNTVLEKLGENPIGPEGDIYWAPVNMTNAVNLIAKAPDPEPELLLDPPTQSQRSLFGNYLPAFTGLFNDAVGRITSRSKRDVETISPILSPVLASISSIITTEARAEFKLTDTWMPADKSIREYLKGVAVRSTDWMPETREQVSGAELSKAIRSLHIGIYREAGAAVATRNINAAA